MKPNEKIDNAIIVKSDKDWKITFATTGKSMNCQWDHIPEDWDNEQISVKRRAGKITELKYRDKSITAKHVENSQKKKDPSTNNTSNFTKPATSPYNFIPLNSTLVEAQSLPLTGHATYDCKRNSGYIDLSIEALTPLFIRGNDNRFLLLDGKPIIPGSSLRGMIRTLVEIVSYGKFKTFEDKRLYKRSTMLELENTPPQPGFLKQVGNNTYKVVEAVLINNSTLRDSFFYKFENSKCTFSTGKFGNRNPKSFEFTVKRNPLELEIPTELRKYYEEDSQRDGDVPNIFKCARERKVKGTNIPEPFGMPVFYTLGNENNIISVSHAKYGRIPYPHKISDHVIPPELYKSDELDFAEAIFGNTDKCSTRVFFEDALLAHSAQDVEMEDKQPKILSSPKPTSFQLYLEQPDKENTRRNNLKHWGDEQVKIRGYKMYWHRLTSEESESPHSWTEKKGKKTDSHPDSIKAVKPGTKFFGRIRFDNLTEAELGCLLTTLQLPQDCCHKLGMAKPLGLGSVRIIPELKIINRENRYNDLFENSNRIWNEGFEKKESIDAFQNQFARYILNKLKKGDNVSINGLWNEDRMQQLKAMLTWEEDKMKDDQWLDKTSYMELGEFKKKAVLPQPKDIL